MCTKFIKCSQLFMSKNLLSSPSQVRPVVHCKYVFKIIHRNSLDKITQCSPWLVIIDIYIYLCWGMRWPLHTVALHWVRFLRLWSLRAEVHSTDTIIVISPLRCSAINNTTLRWQWWDYCDWQLGTQCFGQERYFYLPQAFRNWLDSQNKKR